MTPAAGVRRRLAVSLLATAATLVPATAAAQTTTGDGASTSPAPEVVPGVVEATPSEPDTRRGGRRPREKARFMLAPSGGWSHFSQWGVPIDAFDAQVAIGVAFPVDAGLVSFDVGGLVTYMAGKTEAGRVVSGAGLGGQVVLHYAWARLGFGLRFGALGAARSTNSSSESSGAADLFASLGVEPFAIDGTPVFLEARVHGLAWGDDVLVYNLSAGFRWCSGGCSR